MNVLEAEGLKKRFLHKKSLIGKKAVYFYALDDISFSLKENEVLGIVGESGSGKTTLAKTISYLHKPDAGNVYVYGKKITEAKQSLKFLRRNIQIVFQNPFNSLDSHYTIEKTLKETCILNKNIPKNKRNEIITQTLKKTEFSLELLSRYPHQLSGGQIQRAAIARILLLNPKIIILDEAVSSLDASVGAKIIDMLIALKAKERLSYIFISHDLKIVRKISDYICVMFAGKIVEKGPCSLVYNSPLHPYTKMLIAAAKHNLKDSPAKIKDVRGHYACPFYYRCPYRKEICKTKVAWQKKDSGQQVLCNL